MNTIWLKWVLKKYGPDILAGMAVGGTFLTAYLGIKSGKTAAEEITMAENLWDRDFTKEEELKCTWKCYIPPLAAAAATSACIIAANSMHLHIESVLMAAAAASGKQLRNLEGAARKTLTAEEFKRVQEAVAEEEAKDIPPWLPTPKDGETLYYEPESEQYFCATPQAMLYAQLHLNHVFQEYWGATLNDWLNVLPGCTRVEGGSDTGWYQGTDYWEDIWTNDSQEGKFIGMEFIDMPESPYGAKRIWYNVRPEPPDADWEPFK